MLSEILLSMLTFVNQVASELDLIATMTKESVSIEQIDIIEPEKIAPIKKQIQHEVFDKRFQAWTKAGGAIFYYRSEIAIPLTDSFSVISNNVAIDVNHVYIRDQGRAMLGENIVPSIHPDLDSNTIEAFGRENQWVHDEFHVLYNGKILHKNKKSIVNFELPIAIEWWASDGVNMFFEDKLFLESSADTLKILSAEDAFTSVGWAHDTYNVYYKENLIHTFNKPIKIVKSFGDQRSAWAQFNDAVFHHEKGLLSIASADSFELVDVYGIWARDNKHAYYNGELIETSDAESFEISRINWAKDKNNVYLRGKIFDQIDFSTVILDNDEGVMDKYFVFSDYGEIFKNKSAKETHDFLTQYFPEQISAPFVADTKIITVELKEILIDTYGMVESQIEKIEIFSNEMNLDAQQIKFQLEAKTFALNSDIGNVLSVDEVILSEYEFAEISTIAEKKYVTIIEDRYLYFYELLDDKWVFISKASLNFLKVTSTEVEYTVSTFEASSADESDKICLKKENFNLAPWDLNEKSLINSSLFCFLPAKNEIMFQSKL